MAAVAEGAPSLEVSAVPGLPDSEPGAEDVKKTIISLSELVDLALCTPEVGWWSEVGGNCDVYRRSYCVSCEVVEGCVCVWGGGEFLALKVWLLMDVISVWHCLICIQCCHIDHAATFCIIYVCLLTSCNRSKYSWLL